jgi:hypothetical protein
MGISRRLRNIAIGQINAIKERLDRIDNDTDLDDPLEEAKARREVMGADPLREKLRTPEEIAGGSGATRPAPAPSPLARHYRVLGLPEGADLEAVDAAYEKLVARCKAEHFTPGTEEAAAAAEILRRVETAYDALRDALDPTVGRFDKLEL